MKIFKKTKKKSENLEPSENEKKNNKPDSSDQLPFDENLGDVLSLNLAKEDRVEHFNFHKGVIIIILFALASGLVIAEGYGLLYFWEKSKIDETVYFEENYRQLNDSIKEAEESSKETYQFKDKLDLANGLISNHVRWTNFFQYLERNTLSTVSYAKFSGNRFGEYSLMAKTDNFMAVDAQVRKLLADEYTRTAKVDQSTISRNDKTNETSASFVLNFSIDDSIFYQ